MSNPHANTLSELARSIEARKQANSQTSYVAKLYQAGLNKILEKVGEEATEVILAAKDLERASSENQEEQSSLTQALLNEVADLWFHNLVMLAHLNCGPNDVLAVLEHRAGQSGLTEKASRSHRTQKGEN